MIIIESYYCNECLAVASHATNTSTGEIRHELPADYDAKLRSTGWYYAGRKPGRGFGQMIYKFRYTRPPQPAPMRHSLSWEMASETNF